VEAASSREIEERIAAYDRGDLQALSAKNVFAEAGRVEEGGAGPGERGEGRSGPGI
jgi:hypothetical protein